MNSEKMTDDRLRDLLYLIEHTWSATAAHQLRAYIAALKEERDEAERKTSVCANLAVERGAELDSLREQRRVVGDALGEAQREVEGLEDQVAALTKERDEALRSRHDDMGRRDAALTYKARLREMLGDLKDALLERDEARNALSEACSQRDEAQTRAGVLGADLDRERMVVIHLKESLRAVSAERDALLERVQALEATSHPTRLEQPDPADVDGLRKALERWRAGARAANARALAFESRLAAIHQRAVSPEAEGVARDAWERALTAREHGPAAFMLGLAAYRRCILGDDTPAQESKAEPPEPSTAEAFAELRATFDLSGASDGEEIGEVEERVSFLLSLLERRMEAMGRMIRDLREVAFDGPSEEKGGPGGESMYDWRQRIDRETKSLTDAPEVYTREEVKQACRDYGLTDAVEAIAGLLGHLRKK
jgi:hypothetical protein